MATIILPEAQDAVTTLGIIASLEMETGIELADLLHKQFKSAGEIDWFESILEYRKSQGEYFGYKTPRDLRFLLAEATHENSETAHMIPGINQAWLNAASSLKLKLNQFHHQQLSPDLGSLLAIATLIDTVAAAPGLETTKWARALISRTKAILSGSYISMHQASTPEVPPETQDLQQKYNQVLESRAKRPPLGSPWLGDRPRRHLTLDRHTRDVYDENGISVSSEIQQQGTEVIDKWLWYFPLGGDIFVAEDGAVMGFIKGDKFMIGWIGTEPEEHSNVVRGFVLAYDYKFEGDDVRETSSNISLIESSRDDSSELISLLAGKVQPGSTLSISDFGDIFVPIEDGELERLGTAHRGIWFPGHLPGDKIDSI